MYFESSRPFVWTELEKFEFSQLKFDDVFKQGRQTIKTDRDRSNECLTLKRETCSMICFEDTFLEPFTTSKFRLFGLNLLQSMHSFVNCLMARFESAQITDIYPADSSGFEKILKTKQVHVKLSEFTFFCRFSE